MKKLLSILLCVLLVVTCFVGCAKKKGGESAAREVKFQRENFKYGLDGVVELCNLESFQFSAQDENYKKYISDKITNDLSQYAQQLTSGTVKDGDITNINYKGSVKGVEFSGGTAENQELTIGSGQFIDGFEEQLIGVKIGQTVTITVTFPEGYSDSTDKETGKTTIKLANQEAQFEVKINSVKRPYSEVNDEFAKAAGFENAEEYNASVEKYALESSVYNYVLENSKITSYPTDEDGTPYAYFKKDYTSYAEQNGTTFEGFLSYNQLTEDTFRQEVLKEYIIFYACFDKLGLSLDGSYSEAVDAEVKKVVEANEGSTEEDVVNYYTKAFIESQLVLNKVIPALAERATVTE